MKLLVDGVFFQLATTGIARVWRSLLCRLATRSDLHVYLLDRGGAPIIEGIERIPFPTYLHTSNAADSTLIQKLCDHLAIDVFASTYYTTPMTTSSVLVLYDMIPEVLGFDMNHRIWQEKALAITHAEQIICISRNTRQDLHSHYPYIRESKSVVAYCGFDPVFFFPEIPEEPRSDWSKSRARPYYLLVGSRAQHKGYKNCSLFFHALAAMGDSSVDVVCAGGEPEIQEEFLALVPKGCTVTRHDFEDIELGEAYRCARALVYPSLYEGFGMPVLEAMACGCPVITTGRGSLLEVAGDAALIITGDSVQEMVGALETIRDPKRRAYFATAGLQRASMFSWETFADQFVDSLAAAICESKKPASVTFYRNWKRLREIQGCVDVNVFTPE